MTYIPEIPANATPQEILRIGVEAANGPVSLACSFSVVDVVIIDMAKELGLDIGVFPRHRPAERGDL